MCIFIGRHLSSKKLLHSSETKKSISSCIELAIFINSVDTALFVTLLKTVQKQISGLKANKSIDMNFVTETLAKQDNEVTNNKLSVSTYYLLLSMFIFE